MRAMKESGIEWIGEIPVGWDIGKTKYLFTVIGGSTPKSDESSNWNGNIVWITPMDLNLDIKLIKNSKRKITIGGLQSCGTTLVPSQSIILSTRAPIGLICIAGVELCTNQGCKSLVSRTNVCNEFYYYYFLIQGDPLNMLGRGTTFLELSKSDLYSFSIPIPPLPEQHAIAAYLDRKCTAIDLGVAKKETLIDKLTEYKKSLIYEAVTGKTEVPA
ncbi:MAG: restriction endonuclease subunit S [Euryarchaeota archaeon]|nr:restriction endonuclease subunit S [Euryarchaeota archaeon]